MHMKMRTARLTNPANRALLALRIQSVESRRHVRQLREQLGRGLVPLLARFLPKPYLNLAHMLA